jgi:hypothetical protein
VRSACSAPGGSGGAGSVGWMTHFPMVKVDGGICPEGGARHFRLVIVLARMTRLHSSQCCTRRWSACSVHRAAKPGGGTSGMQELPPVTRMGAPSAISVRIAIVVPP